MPVDISAVPLASSILIYRIVPIIVQLKILLAWNYRLIYIELCNLLACVKKYSYDRLIAISKLIKIVKNNDKSRQWRERSIFNIVKFLFLKVALLVLFRS